MLIVVLVALACLAAVWGFVAFRRWHLAWGTTPQEVAKTLAGDEVPVTRFGMHGTRAITIEAPPEAVYPWIAQIGAGKAGWYSYDLLDNLGRESARVVLDEWQHPKVGDPAGPMNPFAPVATSPWRIAACEEPLLLLWRNGDLATWVWSLTPTADGGTRLVSRLHVGYKGASGLAFAPLLEVADFPMFRKMLLGIKERAEVLASADARDAQVR